VIIEGGSLAWFQVSSICVSTQPHTDPN
jgi:hypothetical protein